MKKELAEIMQKTIRFDNFSFPVNPRKLEISFQKEYSFFRLPFQKEIERTLRSIRRIVSGEGFFTGDDASERFAELEKLFLGDVKRVLVIPGHDSCEAFFTELSMTAEPGPNLIGYRFVFTEVI